MAELGYGYASISKFDDNGDGTLTVYGKATDETLDVDKQICDDAWLKQAMPDWMMQGGNVREMHSSIAAGVATDYENKSDGHYITAKVVDEGSIKKVKAGVLKGFSIGIRNPQVIRDNKAAGGRIVGGMIVEVSLVDRPANPSAKLMVAKAAGNGELMSVEQVIPTPADVVKSIENIVESVEHTVTDVENVAHEVVADVAPVVADVVEVVSEVAAEVVEAETDPVKVVEDVVAAIAPETEIVDAAKSLIATLNKFDQSLYDNAMGAIADLIASEAQEMKQGDDELDSIKELLRAAKHLACWYEGEVAEGEVPGAIPTGYVDDYDDSLDLAVSPEVVKSAIDSAEADILTKAIAAATDAVKSEVELLKSALDVEKEKSATLEAELVVAKNAVVGGGPKRAALNTPSPKDITEVLLKAADYRAKAAATSDRVLAEGYEALAKDLEKSAKKEAK